MHNKEEKESDILGNVNIYFDFVNVFSIHGFAFYGRLPIPKAVLYHPVPEASANMSHRVKMYSELETTCSERRYVRLSWWRSQWWSACKQRRV
jgi:hypothetical protein